MSLSFCVIVILCHCHFVSFSFLKEKSALYNKNIYIYLLYSGGNDIEFQKWHKMTMTQNDTFSFSYYLDSSWKGKLYTKIQGLRIPHIHSNLQYCFLSFLPYFCLTSHHGFEQTAEKCIIFAEEKQHSAIWKQAFIALVCIFFKEEKLHLSKIFKQA